MMRLVYWLSLVAIMPCAVSSANDPKDPSTWTPIKIAGKQRAPEFEDIAEWLNSPPLVLTISEARC